jgi:hypothetical protein
MREVRARQRSVANQLFASMLALRMRNAMSSLQPLRERDFPPDLQPYARVVLSIRRQFHQRTGDYVFYTYGSMTPKQRDEWTAALMKLYDALRRDQGRLEEREQHRKTKGNAR